MWAEYEDGIRQETDEVHRTIASRRPVVTITITIIYYYNNTYISIVVRAATTVIRVKCDGPTVDDPVNIIICYYNNNFLSYSESSSTLLNR